MVIGFESGWVERHVIDAVMVIALNQDDIS